MQQNTSTHHNHTPKRSKQFLQMLLGMIVSSGFAALWIGLCADHTAALVTGCATLALGVFHILIGYNNARHSFRHFVQRKEETRNTATPDSDNYRPHRAHDTNRYQRPREHTNNYHHTPNRNYNQNYNRKPYARNYFG